MKKWLDTRPQGVEARAMAAWAKAHGHVFKTVRTERGGVIDCKAEGRHNWRIEWGESQRLYIQGTELRMLEDLGVSQDFQLLMLSRALATQLETDVFERFTEAMQTQIDHTMPEEMRWLAMFPRVQIEHKLLKARFHLQSPNEQAAQAWITGELLEALDEAAQTFLVTDPPFVLMLLRGRLYLRMQSLKMDDALLDGVSKLFHLAAARARTVGGQVADRTLGRGGKSSAADASASSAWQSQLPSELPSELPDSTLKPNLPAHH